MRCRCKLANARLRLANEQSWSAAAPLAAEDVVLIEIAAPLMLATCVLCIEVISLTSTRRRTSRPSIVERKQSDDDVR